MGFMSISYWLRIIITEYLIKYILIWRDIVYYIIWEATLLYIWLSWVGKGTAQPSGSAIVRSLHGEAKSHWAQTRQEKYDHTLATLISNSRIQQPNVLRPRNSLCWCYIFLQCGLEVFLLIVAIIQDTHSLGVPWPL